MKLLFRGALATRWSREEPTDEVMAKINSLPMVGRELKPDEVIVRTMLLMNTVPMKPPFQAVHFSERALEETRPLVRGRPVTMGHVVAADGPKIGFDAQPVGRYFDAQVTSAEGLGPALFASYFGPNDDYGQRIDRRIDIGVFSEVSPTVDHDPLKCSLCGAEGLDCKHVLLRAYEGQQCYAIMEGVSQFYEGAMVASGQQRSTGYRTAAEQVVETGAALEQVFARSAAHEAEESGGLDAWFSDARTHGIEGLSLEQWLGLEVSQ